MGIKIKLAPALEDIIGKFKKLIGKHKGIIGAVVISILFVVVFWGLILKWRASALWTAIFITGSDVLILVVYYFFPNFLNMKELAEKFGWEINKFWAGTTIPISLGMLIISLRLRSHNLGLEGLILMSTVSLGWALVLAVGGMRESSLSKWVDALKWFFFSHCVIAIFLFDMVVV